VEEFMSDLERRIADALTDPDVTSVAVGELVIEVEAELEKAAGDLENVRTRALDPALSPDPKAAREAIADIEFTVARLKALKPRLSEHCIRVRHAEDLRAWGKRYDELLPQRDSLAEELAGLYREFAPRLADVLARIRAFNAEISRLSFTKPHVNFPLRDAANDPRYLLEVELHARGLKCIGYNRFSLDKDLVLPDFDDPSKKLWPPLELSGVARAMLAQEGGPRVVYRGSHTPEFHEARVARQREEAERQAAYYERLNREKREAYERAQRRV
jgi:hypothetical protein